MPASGRRLRRLALFLFAVSGAGGCSRSCDGGGASPASASSAKPTEAPRPSASARAGVPREAGAPTSAERRSALRAIAEGRKLTRAKDYAGAVGAFGRALAVDPADAQVLAELAFAAQQARDYDRAEAANARALLLASDPKLKAQVLYNQGRLFEVRNARDKAIEAYRRSLAQRDNAEVKRRLAALAGPEEPGEQAEGVPCPSAMSDIGGVCACLADAPGLRSSFLTPEPDPDSDASPAPPSSCKEEADTPALGDGRLFVIEWTGGDSADTAHLLAVRAGGQVRLVAELGRDFEPGAWGVHEHFTLDGGEARTVGGHAVVVVRSEQTFVKTTIGGMEFCSTERHDETVCAMGGSGGVTRCVATVPVNTTSGCKLGGEPPDDDSDDDSGEGAALREMAQEIQSRAHEDTARTTWTIDPDGKLIVTLTPGSAAEAIEKSALGPHELF